MAPVAANLRWNALLAKNKETPQMNFHYRGHRIQAAADLNVDTNEWAPKLTIMWTERSKEVVKQPRFTITFAAKEDAISHGLQFARQWIDDGKPEL